MTTGHEGWISWRFVAVTVTATLMLVYMLVFVPSYTEYLPESNGILEVEVIAEPKGLYLQHPEDKHDDDTVSKTREASKEESTPTQQLDPNAPRSLKPLSFALYPFVKFMTYRISSKAFLVVGLTSVVARAYDRPIYNCQWTQKGREAEYTDAQLIYIKNDENRMPYATAMVNCTFPDPVGSRDGGGRLKLAVSITPMRNSPSGTIISDVFEEPKGDLEKFERVLAKDYDPPFEYAFCGPPMHGRIRADWILSWLMYHYELWEGKEGRVRFFFYNNGGLNAESRKVLDPFLRLGVVEIVDVLDEWIYPTHYHNQVLFINDCLQRTRFIARWTFFQDFDEFLYIPLPNTLRGLLEQHKDKPWLTWASMKASIELCRPPSSPDRAWPEIENMMWIEKQPECRYTKNIPDPWLCVGPLGRRKYVVNPRRVLAAGVHYVVLEDVVPELGSHGPRGENLNGTIARLHHYQGALSTNRWLCGNSVNASFAMDLESNTQYTYDEYVAASVKRAREHYIQAGD